MIFLFYSYRDPAPLLEGTFRLIGTMNHHQAEFFFTDQRGSFVSVFVAKVMAQEMTFVDKRAKRDTHTSAMSIFIQQNGKPNLSLSIVLGIRRRLIWSQFFQQRIERFSLFVRACAVKQDFIIYVTQKRVYLIAESKMFENIRVAKAVGWRHEGWIWRSGQ